MSKFFKKEIASNPFTGPNGQQVQFEILPSDTGVIVLDETKDAELITALTEAFRNRRGGVVEVTEQEYHDIKKNKEHLRPSVAFLRQPKMQTFKSPELLKRPESPASRVAADRQRIPAPTVPPPPVDTEKVNGSNGTPKLDGKTPVPPKVPQPRLRKKRDAEQKAATAPPAAP